jgi:hypothetical protein
MSACICCHDLARTPLQILISDLRAACEGCSSCQLLWNATTAIIGLPWDEFYHHIHLPPRSEDDTGPLRVEFEATTHSTYTLRRVVYQIYRKEGSCLFMNIFEECVRRFPPQTLTADRYSCPLAINRQCFRDCRQRRVGKHNRTREEVVRGLSRPQGNAHLVCSV